jgi:hypothetical protein
MASIIKAGEIWHVKLELTKHELLVLTLEGYDASAERGEAWAINCFVLYNDMFNSNSFPAGSVKKWQIGGSTFWRKYEQ